jgi:hypothetical protein
VWNYDKLIKAGIENLFCMDLDPMEESKPHYYCVEWACFLIELTTAVPGGSGNQHPCLLSGGTPPSPPPPRKEFGEELLKQHYINEKSLKPSPFL